MEYGALVERYRRLADTDATSEKTAELADLFGTAGEDLPVVVRLVQGRPYARWESLELGVSSRRTLAAIERATGVGRERLEERWRETGDLGDVAAWAARNDRQQTLVSRPLTVQSVYDRLRELASYEGSGSDDRRVDALAGLVSDADPEAARYVVRTALGHLRIGVGAGLVRDALAEAFLDGSESAVRAVERASQVRTDYAEVATTAREDGLEGLAALSLTPGRPIRVMLAETAESIEAGLAALRPDSENDDGADDGSDDGPSDRSSDGPTTDATPTTTDGDPDDEDDEDEPNGDADPPSAAADADPGDDSGDEGETGSVLAEVKYDGMRAQVHVDGDDVWLFTRRMDDVTAQFPEVVAAVRDAVGVDRAVLEGEVVAYDPATGDPLPFQELSTRIKREDDVAAAAAERPARLHLFDLPYDGDSLLDRPLADRLDRLDSVVDLSTRSGDGSAGEDGNFGAGGEREGDRPGTDRSGIDRNVDNPVDAAADRPALDRATHRWVDDEATARAFYREALDRGHEGLMLKNPAATYQPGRRVGYQLKVKPTMEPLDLVVTRAVYSEGRRSEMLGRLYLGCYDPDAGAFREVGRLSTGYTDEQLAALTDRLERLAEAVDGREVALPPEVVLAVEYEAIQESPEYDSGYALRFPRFLERREDLAPEDADDLDRIERLYDRQ